MVIFVPMLLEPNRSYQAKNQFRGTVKKVVPTKISIWGRKHKGIAIMLQTGYGKVRVDFPTTYSKSLVKYLMNKDISFLESDENLSFYNGQFSKFYMIIDHTSPALDGVPRGLERWVDYS